MIDFKGLLNTEQYAVATAPEGPMLVLAAAGTGKTRTLVYRVAHLVENGVNPDNILLLTFTNRAAQEMLERTRNVVGRDISGIMGGTFHHMSNRVLRRYAKAIGFNNDFGIIDSDDARSIVTHSIKDRGLKTKEFPKAKVLLGLFSTSTNTGASVDSLIEDRFDDGVTNTDDIKIVYKDYVKQKQKLNAMDFDDLLVNCLRLFRESPDILKKYQELFQYVLVDEYQDTNMIQAALVDLLGKGHNNVLVVGDDFQSIYSWRGADFKNIMTFPERYPDCRIYKLETNYRSVPEILDVANACIAGNPEQFQKTMRATRESSLKPIVTSVSDGYGQARSLVEKIKHLRRSGYKLSDIAVLYRAHFHSMELQMELTRERIPFDLVSGVRFFEQAHIKDVLSLVKVLENPSDALSFRRLICMLPGVGDKTCAKIWNKMGERFDFRNKQNLDSVRDMLRAESRKLWDKIAAIMEAYDEEHLGKDFGEIARRFLDDFYEKHAVNIFDDHQKRFDDIKEMIRYSSKYESVSDFLSDVALLTNVDKEYDKTNHDDKDLLQLSTIHQAKGMEWPVVALLWMADGMFPSKRSMDDSGGESEERRLFYVAVTRAKDELYMYVPKLRRSRDGSVVYYTPSRFITEIQPALIQTYNECPSAW